MADCEYPQLFAQLALIILIAMLVVWVWREMRPLVADGYVAGGQVFSNKNLVTYVGLPPCADRVSAGPGCGSNYGCVSPTKEGLIPYKSGFFPINNTTFFGADGIMEHVTDPNECIRIGTRPEFMMIQNGQPVYRCVRYGEPMRSRR